jgi:hypothetical protein
MQKDFSQTGSIQAKHKDHPSLFVPPIACGTVILRKING